jgi:hypothetical protein
MGLRMFYLPQWFPTKMTATALSAPVISGAAREHAGGKRIDKKMPAVKLRKSARSHDLLALSLAGLP